MSNETGDTNLPGHGSPQDHQFRNILAVVLGNVSLVMNDLDPEDTAYRRLAKAEAACRQLKRLLDAAPEPPGQAFAAPELPPPPTPPIYCSPDLVNSPSRYWAVLDSGRVERILRQPLERPRPTRGRVLVVEDDDIMREAAGTMLIHCGYESDLAGDAQEALELYRKAAAVGHPFVAVLMDLELAGSMDGRATLAALLALDPGARVVLSTAAPERVPEYRRKGFAGLVAKPYTVLELSNGLGQVLHGSDPGYDTSCA